MLKRALGHLLLTFGLSALTAIAQAQSTREWSETCDQLARHIEVIDYWPSQSPLDTSRAAGEIREYRALALDACDLAYLQSQKGGGMGQVFTQLLRPELSTSQMLTDMEVFVQSLNRQQGEIVQSLVQGYWQDTQQVPLTETGFILIGQTSGQLSYGRLLAFLDYWAP